MKKNQRNSTSKLAIPDRLAINLRDRHNNLICYLFLGVSNPETPPNNPLEPLLLVAPDAPVVETPAPAPAPVTLVTPEVIPLTVVINPPPKPALPAGVVAETPAPKPAVIEPRPPALLPEVAGFTSPPLSVTALPTLVTAWPAPFKAGTLVLSCEPAPLTPFPTLVRSPFAGVPSPVAPPTVCVTV